MLREGARECQWRNVEGVVKCRNTSSDSGVKIGANYRSELGLNEL